MPPLKLTPISLLIISTLLCSCFKYASAKNTDLTISTFNPIQNSIEAYSNPEPSEKNYIHISAAKNEFEPAAFLIKANTKNLRNVKIVVSDLVNQNEKISAQSLDIRVVKFWYQARGAWINHGRPRLAKNNKVYIPELLLYDDNLIKTERSGEKNYIRNISAKNKKEEYKLINKASLQEKRHLNHAIDDFYIKDSDTLQSVAINKNDKKLFWITLKAPSNISSGEYKGTITIHYNYNKTKEIPISVTIYPFTLDSAKIAYSVYYRAKLNSSGTISSEYKNTEQLNNEILNIQNHGVDYPTLQESASSIANFEKQLEIRYKNNNLPTDKIYLTGVTTREIWKADNKRQKLYKNLAQLKKILQKYNFKEIYIYGHDEAKGKDLLAQKSHWKNINNKGFKIFVAGYRDAFPLVGKELQQLNLAHQPITDHIGTLQSTGGSIFSYANPQTGTENPALFRQNYGLLLWALSYDGAIPYAYQDAFGSIWNDFDHPKYRDHCFTYPTATGVIDTIAWEGFREAIDDVRYLNTLENLLAKDYTRSIKNTQVIAAKQFLATLRENIKSGLKNTKYTPFLGYDLDDIRAQAANHIIALKQNSH